MGKSFVLYTIACLTLLGGLSLCSCENKQISESKANKADSIIFDVGIRKDYERMRVLADSFEVSGDISSLNANRWRGVSYYREGNNNMAEICYRKALECNINSEQDQVSYIKSARRLSEILLVKGDYEGSISIAIPAVEKMEKAGIGSDIDYAILLNNIGCCQLNLGHDEEAKESFVTAREHYVNRWQSDSTSRGFQEAVVGTVYTSMAYINTRKYDEAIYWIDRSEMLLNKYRQKPDARSEYFDEYQGRIEIMRAIACEGLGNEEKATLAYTEFLKTDYSKTPAGRINATDYLIVAQRYQEAAYNYRYLEQALRQWGMGLSLDNIQLYLLPKYNANAQAGRTDSAQAMGAFILSVLDSAITDQKDNTAAELATIYNTNQKDAQIVQQQADLQRSRWINTMIILALVIIFFTVYALYRRRAQKSLAAANQKLEEGNMKLSALNTQLSALNTQLVTANARAEESSMMKTNFIQQISHEIRTPLNILSGFTQIITTPGMELDEATRADINRQINENTNRITGLVNKMLELSDTTSKAIIEKNDDVPAIQIAAQAAEDSGINDAPNVTFDLQIAPEAEATILHTNLAHATRALVLLLDNAVKFISAPNAPASEGTVRLIVSQTDSQVFFAIEDTGIGVPQEEAEHIFEEFVQLDDYYDGTGIGLTVARSIARRLGGDITLDTTYSPGARFVLMLPLASTTE
ncbi:HAMP domain-containing sensor histidine kinase [Prevotella sp. E2-28]|uniref:sensor histidine kinase n=1 Tax=Prevotella sp. E2-28 TaxID=2913620 RepID=UPI001EDA33E5|nr:HAMP domain-containing sensor histidine kinase [Prevotella sp. E2-28]UKK54215.1 ATP-binding protein [Prevotella sp. E2-28]